MKVDNSAQIRNRIEELKRGKHAVILAHYYTLPEVQEVADFLGDSLALSVRAQSVDAEIILFAGVHFMAETAKVLCPGKKVLIPCPEAGCSLAESCDARDFAAFKARYPGHTVVSYVNTTVGVKALTDICCTSSNALKVVESIPADRPVIFAPDRNLGAYIRKLTGRENIYMNGAILGMSRSEIDAKLADIIAFSEIGDFIDTPAKRYSSGMYVKLAFAVAAHLDSEILVMDEVLAVGDMAFQQKCLHKMRQAADEEGKTILYVSHNMNTIRQLCARCIVMDRGKVIEFPGAKKTE